MNRSTISVREVAWQDRRFDIERFRSRVRSEAGDRPGARGGCREPVPERTLDALRSTHHLCALVDTHDEDDQIAAHVLLHPMPSEELSRFEMEHLDEALRVWMLSGFAVAVEHHNGLAAVKLFEAVYERARGLGADVLLVDVGPDKVLMFEALGFFRATAGRRLDDGDFRVPMLLNLQDVAYLRRVGSPLAAIGQRYLNPNAHGDRLLASLGGIVQETRPPRRAVVGPMEVDADPRADDEGDDAPGEGLLRQLDEFLVSGILARGLRQTVPRGTNLHASTGAEGRIYYLVRGHVGLVPAGARAPIAYLDSGDVIAHTALAEGAATAPIRAEALSECTVLALCEADLEKIVHADPILGAQLMFKLLRGMVGRVSRTTQLLVHDRAPGPSTMAARGRLRIRPEDVLPGGPSAWRRVN